MLFIVKASMVTGWLVAHVSKSAVSSATGNHFGVSSTDLFSAEESLLEGTDLLTQLKGFLLTDLPGDESTSSTEASNSSSSETTSSSSSETSGSSSTKADGSVDETK